MCNAMTARSRPNIPFMQEIALEISQCLLVGCVQRATLQGSCFQLENAARPCGWCFNYSAYRQRHRDHPFPNPRMALNRSNTHRATGASTSPMVTGISRITICFAIASRTLYHVSVSNATQLHCLLMRTMISSRLASEPALPRLLLVTATSAFTGPSLKLRPARHNRVRETSRPLAWGL